jgi:hypothetical protein
MGSARALELDAEMERPATSAPPREKSEVRRVADREEEAMGGTISG